MTWNKGDIVVHQRDGICRIIGTTSMASGYNPPIDYYVLEPLYENGSKLYIPIDRADNFLRKPISSNDIDKILNGAKDESNEKISWIDDEKKRQSMLSDARKSSDFDVLIGLVSLFYNKKQEQISKGRKFHSADEQFLKDTETRINREFANALGIAPDDVPAYIQKQLAS